MTVTLTTRAFERSHGRKPRGRGAWLFQASATEVAFDRDLSGEMVGFTGNLGEARKLLAAAGFTGLMAVLP